MMEKLKCLGLAVLLYGCSEKAGTITLLVKVAPVSGVPGGITKVDHVLVSNRSLVSPVGFGPEWEMRQFHNVLCPAPNLIVLEDIPPELKHVGISLKAGGKRYFGYAERPAAGSATDTLHIDLLPTMVEFFAEPGKDSGKQ